MSTECAFEHRGGTPWGLTKPALDHHTGTPPDKVATTIRVTDATQTWFPNDRQDPACSLNQRVVGSSPTRPTIRNPVANGVPLVSEHCIPKGHRLLGARRGGYPATTTVDAPLRRYTPRGTTNRQLRRLEQDMDTVAAFGRASPERVCANGRAHSENRERRWPGDLDEDHQPHQSWSQRPVAGAHRPSAAGPATSDPRDNQQR